MITGAIASALASVFHWVMGGLPVLAVPSWLSTSGPMATVFGAFGSMGVWFPTTLLVAVLASVLGAWLLGFGIKVIRIVASFVTVGGGSAG